MAAIRRNAKVRYIGKDELAKGMTFYVLHKCGNLLEVMFPCKYLDGSVHKTKCCININEFELIKED